jgi:hypothetical protein
MMALSIRFGVLLCLTSALSFAENWSGDLVDSRCWGFQERNVNPTDTLTFVDRDRNLEISLCSPSLKTKSFAIVRQDGLSLALDAAGNAKAAALVRKTGGKSGFIVVITGAVNRNTIQVDSISTAR